MHDIAQSFTDTLPPSCEGAVAITLREGGRAVQRLYHDEALLAADNIRNVLAAAAEWTQDNTAIELNVIYDRKPLKWPLSQVAAIHRGLRGLHLRYEDGPHVLEEILPPTTMIARNLGFGRAGERFAAQVQERFGSFDESKLRAEWFASHQRLYLPGQGVMEMYRGNRIVPPEAADGAGAMALADGMAGWLCRNTSGNGRITYKYWPSRGETSEAINLIRLFMAVLCLFRIAAWKQCSATQAQAEKALEFHLSRYYRQDGTLGYVLEGDKVKLGACALAGLCIEASSRPERYGREREGIAAMVEHLWQEDGSFCTFYRPEDRDDCQNFYPGEALLYWAVRWQNSGDEALLARIMQSFAYYREWHRENANPAFIPWHTQAYYIVWRQTQSPHLRDFIFEMNDWLLPVQQWDEIPYPDEWGRFHDPRRPFGPPHASATGVYLEGLADAWALACEQKDGARAQAYAVAIRRAVRSLMQLQFKDEVDMFYISRRNRALGGLRTTCYHNEIRVDNVQHGLMGAMVLLARGFWA